MGAAFLPNSVAPTNRVLVLRRLDGNGWADIAHIGRDVFIPRNPRASNSHSAIASIAHVNPLRYI
jgi:hypothetical protein